VLLKVGQAAPDFDVLTHAGERLRLADHRGRRNVVLYFYPKDFTTICTAEACGFRDMYEEIAKHGAEVIGVSLDTDESHRRFAEKHKIPFPLVSDRDKSITRNYGAISTIRSLLGLAKRLTYIIDKNGVIAGVFEGELSAKTHLRGARELLQRLV
jgi:thioredoxin-dependent peroxiredoxin